MAEIFALRLNATNLASKSDIANFVNKTDFDNTPKNEINELSKKVKAVSTKGLINDLWISLVFLMEQNIFLQEYFKII